MKKLTVLVLAIAALVGSGMATSFLGRSSTMNKKYQFFGWTNFGYNQTASSYDWASGRFVGTRTVSCDLTLAYGLANNFDIDLVAPLAMKQKGGAKSNGLGDLMLYARYGIAQAADQPLKVALLFGANLPTTSKSASPALSDRTTDVAFGLSMNTKKLGRFYGHIRAAYWFDGDLPGTAVPTKVGDMFEYVLCGDYSISKTVTPEVALTGYIRDQNNLDGTWVPKSEGSQHLLSLLVIWKPVSNLTIRPKLSIPVKPISQGGTLASYYGGLDVWIYIP